MIFPLFTYFSIATSNQKAMTLKKEPHFWNVQKGKKTGETCSLILYFIVDHAQDQQVVHSEKQQDKSSEKRKRGHLENLTRSFPNTGLHAHRRQPSLNTPSLIPVDSEPLLPGEDGLQAEGSARSWSWGELLHSYTGSQKLFQVGKGHLLTLSLHAFLELQT